jgi:hypothetical protein
MAAAISSEVRGHIAPSVTALQHSWMEVVVQHGLDLDCSSTEAAAAKQVGRSILG